MLKFSATIAMGLALLTTVTGLQAAHATQFKKLLQAGQSINDVLLISIGNATLGRDGQVVAVLGTVRSRRDSFIGVYSISKGGNLRLVEEVAGFRRSDSSGESKFFSAPSLSEGKIAYWIGESRITATGRQGLASLRFGTAGDMKTILSPRPVISFEIPAVVLTNGIIHILEPKDSQVVGDKASAILSQVDTNQNNALTVLGQVFDPLSYERIRAGADSLVVQQRDRTSGTVTLLERPLSQGTFSPIVPIGKNPGSCGFAVSFGSVVSCSEKNPQIGQANYGLSARFGKNARFQPIEIPNLAKVTAVDSPSISQDKVVFRTVEQDPNNPSRNITKIYLSFSGKTPKVLLQTGSKLDGSTVSEVKLVDSDPRSIAVNSVLVEVSFTDQPLALYRVDF